MTTTNVDIKRNGHPALRRILLILVLACVWTASVISALILGNRSGALKGIKSGYGDGYSAGHREGVSAGYRDGYSAGSRAEAARSYQSGYRQGRADGFKAYQESVRSISITQKTDSKIVESLLGMPDLVVPGKMYSDESCWVYGDVKIYFLPGHYAGTLLVNRWEGNLQRLIQERVAVISAQVPQE